jgi:hypothetical protein
MALCIATALNAVHAWELPSSRLLEATYVPLPTSSQYGLVCSGYNNAVCSDMSEFYRMDRRLLRRVGLVTELSPSWGVRTQFTEGAAAPKLVIRPRLLLGLIGSRSLPEGRSVTAEVFGTFGGEIRHRPCLDDYDRQYFCGSLTSWQDFAGKRVPLREYGLKFTAVF